MFKVKEIKMNIGDRVVMIENHELRRGVIRNIYTDIPTPILVVEFDDGEIEKVYPGDVALEPKTEIKEDQEVKEEKKPVEKSEITITPEEFRKISIDTVMKFTNNDPIVSLGLTMFCADLHQALFVDEGENE